MMLKNIFALASVLGLAWCQTPPGFKPAASNNLGVRFGKNITVDPGDKVRQNGMFHINDLTYNFDIHEHFKNKY